MIFQIDNVETLDTKLGQKMFALRKHVFCDALHWDIPHCNGLEADIFDFNSAFYMNWIDPQRNSLLGSVRLMPMTHSNLLNTVFTTTIDTERLSEIERDPTVWEGARLCIDEQLVHAQFGNEGLYRLLYGLFLSCEAMGIQTLVCNCGTLMYRLYRQSGLQLEHLGKTSQFCHGDVHCLCFDISGQNRMILEERLSSTSNLLPCQTIGDGILSAHKITLPLEQIELIA